MSEYVSDKMLADFIETGDGMSDNYFMALELRTLRALLAGKEAGTVDALALKWGGVNTLEVPTHQFYELARQLEQTNACIAEQRDGYKRGYKYLQDRMESLDRHGWAHDYDSEIDALAPKEGTITEDAPDQRESGNQLREG